MGSLRGLRTEASLKNISPEFRDQLRELGIYHLVSGIRMETTKTWGQDMLLFSLKNLSNIFRKYYGEKFEDYPPGTTYTVIFKENADGQLRLAAKPDNVREKATEKIRDKSIAKPEDLKSPKPTIPIEGFET
jgi:hypothetical protein